MSDEINLRTGGPYYAGSYENIIMICKVLNIDGGRLARINPDRIRYFMDLVEQLIDGYLEEYYFTPIRPFNNVMMDGTTKLVFPGRLRKVAQYWASGLLLQTEFQGLEPNANDAVERYIEDSKKETFQMTFYNQRLPGQVMKSAVSRTFPPSLQPAMPPSENI